MKHSAKEWFAVTRFWSFPVSSMPVVATLALLCWRSSAFAPLPHHWLCGILAVVGIVVFHAAGNVLSDWFDYRTGVDNESAYAIPNLVFHQFEPREYLTFSIILFAIGIVIGLVLTWLSGWQLLVIGGIGFVLTVLYSFLKYHALGDANIFIVFGVLPMLGTSYVFTGTICWEALVLSIPLGVITTSVLHINNTSDIVSDRAAGMKSFAMLLGDRTSVRLYQVYQIVPFVAVIVAVILGYLPWLSMLCFVAFRAAWGNIRSAGEYAQKGVAAIEGLDQRTAQLQLIFSLSLSVALFAAALL